MLLFLPDDGVVDGLSLRVRASNCAGTCLPVGGNRVLDRDKDLTVALNFQTAGPDPDPIVHLFYGCGSGLNWDGYCNPEVDKMIEQQSRDANPDRRKRLLWTIERKLAEDNARPIIYYRPGGTCTQPYVKDLTIGINYIFGSWRMEDVWLDK